MRSKAEIKRVLSKAADKGAQIPDILFGTAELERLNSGLYRLSGRSSEKWFDEAPFVEEYEQTFTSKEKAADYAFYIHCGRADKFVQLLLDDKTVTPVKHIGYTCGENTYYEG